MMRKTIALLMVLAIAVAFTGCAGIANLQKEPSRVVTVELEETPSTGFEWTYSVDTEGILKETGNEFVEGEGADKTTGTPGTRRFTFETVADGRVTLTFEYKQEWEGGQSSKTYSETYEVKEGLATLKGFSSHTSSQDSEPTK